MTGIHYILFRRMLQKQILIQERKYIYFFCLQLYKLYECLYFSTRFGGILSNKKKTRTYNVLKMQNYVSESN